MTIPQDRGFSLARAGLRLFQGVLRRIVRGARWSRVVVTGDSMEPTLRAGDRLVVQRSLQGLRPGQVVVLRDPRNQRRRIVKRVARVLADRIEVRGDNVNSSTDSRHFGFVDLSLVEGVVRYRYFPASQAGPMYGSTVLGVEGDGSEPVISQRTR